MEWSRGQGSETARRIEEVHRLEGGVGRRRLVGRHGMALVTSTANFVHGPRTSGLWMHSGLGASVLCARAGNWERKRSLTRDSTVWHADMPKHSYGDAVLGTTIFHVDGADNTGALTALLSVEVLLG